MFWNVFLFLGRKAEIKDTCCELARVDVCQSTVVDDFAGIEFIVQPELLIVDDGVSAKKFESSVERGGSFCVGAGQEARDADLKVGNGHVAVEGGCFFKVGDCF